MATIVDQEYTATEIIKKDLERGGFTKNEQKILKDLTSLIQKNKAVIVRHNNTVFVGKRKAEEGVLEVHMFTLDPAAMLPEAMKVAFDSVKKAGVKRLTSETTNMRFVQMLKQLGSVKTKKSGQNIEWTLEVNK